MRWSGFALLRGATAEESGPLAQERLSSQLQLGIDWSSSPTFGAHLHLIARNDEGTRRGSVGIPEAYIEANLRPGNDRLRLRGGAFFLPTSRENVDALWENPYAITSSALNSWLGEEFRPIGIDATYSRRGAFAGATLFRGNDTFGALPPARGWRLGDHWTLLGEWVLVEEDEGEEYYTSVSAETDGRIGWSARAGWNGPNFMLQLTHIDNRSDGLEYGQLFNWNTRFDIVAAEYTVNDWTIAAEVGWGPTFLIDEEFGKWLSDLRTGYVFASRRLSNGRITLRAETFSADAEDYDQALTLAYFWEPRGMLRIGGEITTTGSDQRALLEVRYHFAGR